MSSIYLLHSNFAQNSEAICNLRIEKEKDNSQAINSESVTIANGAIVRKKEMEWEVREDQIEWNLKLSPLRLIKNVKTYCFVELTSAVSAPRWWSGWEHTNENRPEENNIISFQTCPAPAY